MGVFSRSVGKERHPQCLSERLRPETQRQRAERKPLTLERHGQLEGTAGSRLRLMRNTRSGRAALLAPARSLLSDDGIRISRHELLRPLKRG